MRSVTCDDPSCDRSDGAGDQLAKPASMSAGTWRAGDGSHSGKADHSAVPNDYPSSPRQRRARPQSAGAFLILLFAAFLIIAQRIAAGKICRSNVSSSWASGRGSPCKQRKTLRSHRLAANQA